MRRAGGTRRRDGGRVHGRGRTTAATRHLASCRRAVPRRLLYRSRAGAIRSSWRSASQRERDWRASSTSSQRSTWATIRHRRSSGQSMRSTSAKQPREFKDADCRRAQRADPVVRTFRLANHRATRPREEAEFGARTDGSSVFDSARCPAAEKDQVVERPARKEGRPAERSRYSGAAASAALR